MKKLEFNLKTVLVANISQAETDYLKTLKFLNANRTIKRAHVNKMKESFNTFGTACATIIVIETTAFGRKEQLIADGQHRVVTAIEMGLTLNVCIIRLEEDTKSNVVRFISVLNNTAKSWSNEQYLLSYSYCDLPIYKKLAKVKKESNLTMTDLHFIYLNNNLNLIKQYKSGTLAQLPNEKRSGEIYKAVKKVYEFIPKKAFTRRALYSVLNDVTDLEAFTDRIIDTANLLKEAEMKFSENEQEFKEHLLKIRVKSPKIK